MKRTLFLMATFAASSVGMTEIGAQTLRPLEARVSSVEDRLAEIERKLSIQQGAPATKLDLPQQTQAPAIPEPKAQNYVIRGGDSIGGIARKFSIPRKALLDANNLAEGQPIYIGETLVIPTQPASPAVPTGNGQVHVVKAGDTLTSLARQYGSTVPAIKQVNRLNSDLIGVGQKIVIPTANAAVQKPTGTTAKAPEKSQPQNQQASQKNSGKYQYDNPLLDAEETYGYYMVQKGDNLYALARDFFTTMRELQRLNKLGTSTVIHPGSELIVPTSKYNDFHNKVAQN